MSEQQHRAMPVEPTEEQQVGSLNASGPSESTENLDQPRPVVPALPRTGDQQVDDALAALLAVQDLEPSEQVEAYVGAHRALQDRLADLEG